jgi:hypothetical protein
MHIRSITFAVAATVSAAGSAASQAPSPDQQIAAAVQAAPDELRANATVLGYGAEVSLRKLREGRNSLVCLADNPSREGFEVACYHEALEPFMARGRELRAEGMGRAEVDRIRLAEADAGTLPMPEAPAMLYVLSAPEGGFDAATGSVSGGFLRWVVHTPYATVESTGISAKPASGAPWLMFPGTARAHIMITPERSQGGSR